MIVIKKGLEKKQTKILGYSKSYSSEEYWNMVTKKEPLARAKFRSVPTNVVD
jgi:hypothetical protein